MRVLAFEYDDESQAAGEGLAAARALRAAGARHHDLRPRHPPVPSSHAGQGQPHAPRARRRPGVDLLSDENGPRVRKTILAFVEANAR
jgi:hypothetical protein